MAREQFFVVLRGGAWKIQHNGQHSLPYLGKASAIKDAIDQAHAVHQHGGLKINEGGGFRGGNGGPSPVAIRRILKGNFPTSSGQDFWSDVFGITARSHLASPTAAG